MIRSVPNPLTLVLFLAAAGALASPALAQPTWGRPKETKPKEYEPSNEPDPSSQEPGRGTVSRPAKWGPDDPEQKQPTWECEGGTWYAAKSPATGVRYTWIMPDEFEKGEAYDVIVILHPSAQNARWAMNTHGVGGGADPDIGDRFRPREILVAVDGLSIVGRTPEQRAFITGTPTIMAFREIMLEITRSMPMRRIYLFGSGTGADFALTFASRFPALADGLVLHRAGEGLTELAFKGKAPTVFLHGARDSHESVESAIEDYRAFAAAGHTGARLRILAGMNDYPTPLKVSECLDWCIAMHSDKPSEVLERARAIAAPKGPDEYGYTGPVWFGGAYEAVQRILPEVKVDAPIADNAAAAPAGDEGTDGGESTEPAFPRLEGAPSDEVMAGAAALSKNLEDHAHFQLEEIRKVAPGFDTADFPCDASGAAAWAWHIRHDFRGLPEVEKWAKSSGYDAKLAEHDAQAGDFREEWESTRDPRERAALAAEAVPNAYFSGALPLNMGATLKAALKAGEDDEESEALPDDVREAFELIQNCESGWNEGAKAYARVWRKWRLEQ